MSCYRIFIRNVTLAVWSTPARRKWTTPFSTAITTLKESPWRLETPHPPSTGRNSGKSDDFWRPFFVYLFGFGFLPLAFKHLQAQKLTLPQLTPYSTATEASEHSLWGRGLEIPLVPGQPAEQPLWTELVRLHPGLHTTAFCPFFQRKESPYRKGQWKQQHWSMLVSTAVLSTADGQSGHSSPDFQTMSFTSQYPAPCTRCCPEIIL